MMEELKPVRLRISRERIMAYAAIANDYNPIHVDPEFAAKSAMGGIIAHGTLSLNLIWQSIEETFGKPVGKRYLSDIRFRAPVRENDVVEAGGVKLAEDIYSVWVKNQEGASVIEGTATIQAGGEG